MFRKYSAHGVCITVWQQIDDGSLFHIGKNAAVLMKQMRLVNSEKARRGRVIGFLFAVYVILEDRADGPFIQTYFAGYLGERFI